MDTLSFSNLGKNLPNFKICEVSKRENNDQDFKMRYSKKLTLLAQEIIKIPALRGELLRNENQFATLIIHKAYWERTEFRI